MTRCPDCDALRLPLARTEGQLASAGRSWIEMRDEADRAIDARDAAVQAYKDSAEVLAQVAAERDRAQEEAVWWQAGAQAIVNLFDPLKARVTDPGFALTIARAAKEAHRTVRVERDRLREEVAARDRALDACAERIAELLREQCAEARHTEEMIRSIEEWWSGLVSDGESGNWPATLGRNLAMGGALCVSRLAAIGLVDGFWAWQPGRGRPHPGVHEVEVP